MREIRPSILIGIGPQAQQTVQQYVDHVRTRQGKVPAILPIVLDYSSEESPFRHRSDGIQYLTFSSPVFEEEGEWPTWLPRELAGLSPTQRARTRAWMRAALSQQADELQEFLLESIPHLSSFAAVEELSAMGLSLVGDGGIDVCVIADLGDQAGSGTFIDVVYLTTYVCRQLGLVPATQGILYLPSATSPAPVEEAIAYAALGELEHCFRTHQYDGQLAPDWVPTGEFVPFDDGCYLLDSVNELGYTLQDASQQTLIASEWLYALTFAGMGPAIRQKRARRYLRSTLLGRSRAYESFGVSIYYVPQDVLIRWMTIQLGVHVLDRILSAEVQSEPKKNGNGAVKKNGNGTLKKNGSGATPPAKQRTFSLNGPWAASQLGNGTVEAPERPQIVEPGKKARAFVERVGLRREVLEEGLRHWHNGQSAEKTLAALRRARLGRLEPRAREALQQIREKHLPTLNRNLGEASRETQQEVRAALSEEIQITLEDMPVGGITMVRRFLEFLSDRVSEAQQEIEEQTLEHRLALRRSLTTVSEAYYGLRGAVMSIPPWPVSILSLVALVVLPVLYQWSLISQVILPLSRNWGLGLLILLSAGVLSGLGFVTYRLLRQWNLVRDQHVRMIRERWVLESRPLVNQAMRVVSRDAQDAITQAELDLKVLVDQMQIAATTCREVANERAAELKRLAAPGPFRSAIDPRGANCLLKLAIPDVDRFAAALVKQAGSVVEWQARADEAGRPLSVWMCDQISLLVTDYLKQALGKIEAVHVLTKGLPEEELLQALERMFGSARPMWNYDSRVLQRAKTQRLTLLSADTSGSAWTELVVSLAKVCPEVIPLNTGDPSMLIILDIHRGLPLFALRRIGEYRTHYAEMLLHSRLPVHTTRASSLKDDLIPIRHRPALSTAALFAAGLALGAISRDADGRYLAPRGTGRMLRLSTGKERSVALMSLDAPARREVQGQLHAIITQQGKRAVRTALDEYMTVDPGLEDWEVREIVSFGRTYDLESMEE